MKLHEVIETLASNGDYWFRPVSWEGRGEAFCFKYGTTHIVPSSRGGEPYMTTNPRDLAGDWEIVNASTVLAERGDLAIS